MKQCFYDILGVSRDADIATIKRAYRKLAMQYHPDRNPGDAEAEHRFKEINEAYDVLKDDQKRAAYDRYGHAAFANGGGPQAHPFDADSFSDIFDQFFGDMMGAAGHRRSGGRRGADLRYHLEITLEEAYHGATRTIEVPSHAPCETCGGSGAEDGTSLDLCTVCNGAGRIRASQGFFMVERTCPSCRGAGRVIASPCKSCQGSGRVEKTRRLSVRIPAGVEDGTRIRLAGEGEAGVRGGPPGDLYIFLAITPHRLFERRGSTVFCEVPLPMTTAVLGGEVEVPTLAGKRVKLRIPEGTQTGRQFRLRGKGMPELNGTRHGDMIIEARVETPVNLTRAQKEKIRALAEELGEDTAPESRSFFAKVREIWDELRD